MKKKSRKKRDHAANPIALAIQRAGPVPAEVVESLRLREWSAIETFAQGKATGVDVRMLRELLGMCACCVELGVGPEAESACHRAAAVLEIITAQQSPDKPLCIDDAQIEVMRELQGYHDLQRAAFTWGGYLKVIDRVSLTMADPPVP